MAVQNTLSLALDYHLAQEEHLKYINEITLQVKRVFTGFGYREIAIPILEPLEPEDALVDFDTRYKFIDHTGKIMSLRADVTVPIAKMVARQFEKVHHPLKYYYVTPVFRYFKALKGEKREFLQGGIEYFGDASTLCDAEVIATAVSVLQENNLEHLHIDIGHIGFLEELFNSLSLSDEQRRILLLLIEQKNEPQLRQYLDRMTLPQKVNELLTKMPRLFGRPSRVYEIASDYCFNASMKKALDTLMMLYEKLCDYGFKAFIHFDLGFTKPMPYYTGVVFKGYVAPYGRPLFQGGRYDRLTEKYGISKPACGLGMNLEDLTEVIKMYQVKKAEANFTDYLLLYPLSQRKKALSLAAKLRKSGYIVETNQYQQDIMPFLKQADYRNTKRVLDIQQNCIKQYNIVEDQVKRLSNDDFLQVLDSNFVYSSIH